MFKIELLNLTELKPHEEYDPKYFEELKNRILEHNHWKWPIIVAQDSYIILDGHHRYNIAHKLGFNKIPAAVVNYYDQNIRVLSRRDEIEVSKQAVINITQQNKVFPKKTTNHEYLQEDIWDSIYKIAPETDIAFTELY